ncbi:hypothetical protein Syun_025757 [Stephania yunnanensis]|uniref:Uncharacterized protein n=1 Tax=Stephania yunnanensis TaxID=152371 RepID=A0AAP0HV41_9MAGN
MQQLRAPSASRTPASAANDRRHALSQLRPLPAQLPQLLAPPFRRSVNFLSSFSTSGLPRPRPDPSPPLSLQHQPHQTPSPASAPPLLKYPTQPPPTTHP